MEPIERSTLQLMSILERDEEKDKINRFSYTFKTHSTLGEKKFIPLYAEELHFLIKRAGWLVTYIYEHHTFEQSKFKKDFVVMNQKSRQAATSPVEGDFFKLLNNSNFGIDFHNNIDNCILEPIYDDLGEISYIKIFTTVINDDTYRDFFSPEHMKEEIIQTFQGKIVALNKNDPTYEARKEYFENKMEEEVDSVESFVKSKNKRKRKFKNLDEKTAESLDPRKKMVIEFNDHEAASIKSIVVKKT